MKDDVAAHNAITSVVGFYGPALARAHARIVQLETENAAMAQSIAALSRPAVPPSDADVAAAFQRDMVARLSKPGAPYGTK